MHRQFRKDRMNGENQEQLLARSTSVPELRVAGSFSRYSKEATRRLDFNRQRLQCFTSLDESNLTMLAKTPRIQNSNVSCPTSLFHRLQREDFPSEIARFTRFLNAHVDQAVLTAKAGCFNPPLSLSTHMNTYTHIKGYADTYTSYE